MAKSEDAIPSGYTYSWASDSDLPLEDFLSKYKPSMVQNDGKKPWIWVRGSSPTQEDANADDAVKEASALLKEITEKVEAIKNDASIPVRSNKKTGAKSKKEVREQVQAEATEKLKEIALKHGYVSGKWLIFASADKVDTIWPNIAKSLVSGPLTSTFAHLAKVATSPESQDSGNYQHLICIYIPNVYDKDKVTEVMKILLRNHGVSLSGVKSNLYTALGIDSKHASGLPSTTWKNSSLISDTEAKELKDEYFTNLASNKDTSKDQSSKVAVATKNDVVAPLPTATMQSKTKPKLKKKVVDDPFASEDEAVDNDKEKPKEGIQAKVVKKKPLPRKKAAVDAFVSDEEKNEDAKPQKKTKLTSIVKKRQASDVESDEESDERPKKKSTKSG